MKINPTKENIFLQSTPSNRCFYSGLKYEIVIVAPYEHGR